MPAPIDPTDPAPKLLAASGLKSATLSFDLGAAWTEAQKSLALEPVTFDFAGVLEASAQISLAHVLREAFSTDLPQAAAMAAQIAAGRLELTLRDTGGVDLAVAQWSPRP